MQQIIALVIFIKRFMLLRLVLLLMSILLITSCGTGKDEGKDDQVCSNGIKAYNQCFKKPNQNNFALIIHNAVDTDLTCSVTLSNENKSGSGYTKDDYVIRKNDVYAEVIGVLEFTEAGGNGWGSMLAIKLSCKDNVGSTYSLHQSFIIAHGGYITLEIK